MNMRRSESETDFAYSQRYPRDRYARERNSGGEHQSPEHDSRERSSHEHSSHDYDNEHDSSHEGGYYPKNAAAYEDKPFSLLTQPNGGELAPPNGICIEHCSYNSECSYCLLPEYNLKMAGMKIFATIMLNAWRRRREDVKCLVTKVEELKRGSMKARNQIHVFNTLFRVEQKRNDELTCQLKRSLESVTRAKSSCESLTTSLISLKADRALLEQQLRLKHKEGDGLNSILSQTKNDLSRSLIELQNLKTSLIKEQRNKEFLENQKNKLVNEICELGAENRKTEEKYCKELQRKDEELCKAVATIQHLDKTLCDLKENAFKVQEFSESDSRLKREIQQLQCQIELLRKELDNTYVRRMRIWSKQLGAYSESFWQCAHILAYYLLPAMPPPKFMVAPKFPFHGYFH